MIWIVGIAIFCFLLFMFPKKVIALLLGIAAIGAAIFGYFQFQNWQDGTRRAQVEGHASSDTKLCPDPNYPISIAIYNRAPDTLENIGMNLKAFKEGFSSEQYSSYISSDKIMKPNSGYAACWSLSDYNWHSEQKTPVGLQWKVEINSVTWR